MVHLNLAVFIFFVCHFHNVKAFMGAKMGVSNHFCDDGKTNLTVDWNDDFSEFTCSLRDRCTINQKILPVNYQIPNFVPEDDQVYHACMNKPIEYKDVPPIRGDHRPLWAKWGEYLYLPPQRWLHNLEHGGIIALYHPCADEDELDNFRKLVITCLYRHIITPYKKLSSLRPFALVSWGAKLEMNYVDRPLAVSFIKKHARHAPEDLYKQGQYDYMLAKNAEIVCDKADNALCPWASVVGIGDEDDSNETGKKKPTTMDEIRAYCA